MGLAALSASDYLAGLQALLPPGPAWSREAQDATAQLLQSWADEFARLDGRVIALLNETDPHTTSELLLDWERVAGLPDPCVVSAGITQSVDQRRAALLSRLATIGGQSPAYFVALAAALGYVISITEFHLFNVNDPVTFGLYSPPWQFAWQVNAALNTAASFSVNSPVSDALAAWSNVALECVFNRLKPAHTVLIFSYT